MTKDNKRIDLRFALTAPGTMWNLLYEGMDQNINLRSTFKGKDEESIEALIKFGEILRRKKDYDINIISNVRPVDISAVYYSFIAIYSYFCSSENLNVLPFKQGPTPLI